ncbi:hypothetical protein GCM10025867_01530 [Frondihabitans sucicola]|uniref:Alpha-galactosidase n=1 Tax=Frondihabitans sucicola TaxID=1268041 RepID=A0ABM8GHS6_9MICO|nr:hypothetical protein [Frondihabitans sucicola]BDZ47912.1 hypothetical protein GCM10025867_01530 [Frondihabitans sucicola]
MRSLESGVFNTARVETTMPPAAVFVQSDADGLVLPAIGSGDGWERAGTVVDVEPDPTGGIAVSLRSTGPVARIALRWSRRAAAGTRIRGDAWERSYGELGFESVRPERVLPWYWISVDGSGAVSGAGVDVRASALAWWQIDPTGWTLWLDVRSGGAPVRLGNRRLDLVTVRTVAGGDPDDVHRALAVALAGGRALPSRGPTVGSNNWYYAYGEGFGPDAVIDDARLVVELADDHPVKPYGVIDDGWNPGGPGSGGPWDAGTPGLFDDMSDVAGRVMQVGARAGLWFRPCCRASMRRVSAGRACARRPPACRSTRRCRPSSSGFATMWPGSATGASIS